MRKKDGITIVALVITIIVMLILVGVVVTLAINGGIIDIGRKASADTKSESEKEMLYTAAMGTMNETSNIDFAILDNNLPEGFIGTNGTYTNIETGNKYRIDSKGNIILIKANQTLLSMYIAGENCTEENCTNPDHLHIGDYVDYNPNEEITSYDLDKGEEVGTYTGYTTERQEMEQEDLEWRVLGRDNNQILLISEKETENEVCFLGYIGYNNYENVLNDACSSLYSNSTIGAISRSINMNDIDVYLDGNNFNKESFGGGSTQVGGYGYTQTFTNVYIPENWTRTNNVTLTSNAYYYMSDDVITDLKKLNILKTSNDYWIASRVISIQKIGDTFYTGVWNLNVYDQRGYVTFAPFCYTMRNGRGEVNWSMRPIVILPENITTEQVPKL